MVKAQNGFFYTNHISDEKELTMKKMVLAVVVVAAIVGGGLYWKNTHSSRGLCEIRCTIGVGCLTQRELTTG